MQVTLRKLSATVVQFEVHVAAEIVDAELDRAYADLSQRAKVRGYRPGRAPRQVLARAFGPSVSAQVAKKLQEETYPKAVSQQPVQIISQPVFEPSPLKAGAPFAFRAKVEVVPDVPTVDFLGLTVEGSSTEVPDALVESTLERLREQVATTTECDDEHCLAEGDIAVLDIEMRAAGRPIPGAAREGFEVVMGSTTLPAPLQADLLGKKKGETARHSELYPQDFPDRKRRGKSFEVDATVRAIKVKSLPALDDEFAKDLEGYEATSLAELREAVKAKLAEAVAQRAEQTTYERLVARLCEQNPIEVPASLVRQQYEQTRGELAKGGNGRLSADMERALRIDSEMKVRAGILMAKISQQQGIKVSEEDIEKALHELVEETGQNIAKLRAEYRGRQRDFLVGMILEDKVLTFLKERADIRPPGEAPAADGAGAAPEAPAVPTTDEAAAG